MLEFVPAPVFGRPAGKLTYGQLDDLSDRLAAGLAAMGIKKGDRVAIIFPNTPQFVIAFFGVLKAGGIVVALNPSFPPPKWVEQLNDCGAEVVITMSLFYNGLNSVRDQTQVKQIIVKPGGRLSLQSHKKRAEHWVVVQGTAQVTCDDKVFLLHENQSTFIPLGARQDRKTLVHIRQTAPVVEVRPLAAYEIVAVGGAL